MIQEGATANCTQYVDVNVEGGPDCVYILDIFNITIAQFYHWNPTVGSDCSGLWAGKNLYSRLSI